MDIEEIFSNTKWSILKELSKGSKSASELAKKSGMTISNATIQLNLLEAKGIIKKTKIPKDKDKDKATEKKNVGKPKKPFELQEAMVLTGILKPGLAERKLTKAKDLTDYEKIGRAHV